MYLEKLQADVVEVWVISKVDLIVEVYLKEKIDWILLISVYFFVIHGDDSIPVLEIVVLDNSKGNNFRENAETGIP